MWLFWTNLHRFVPQQLPNGNILKGGLWMTFVSEESAVALLDSGNCLDPLKMNAWRAIGPLALLSVLPFPVHMSSFSLQKRGSLLPTEAGQGAQWEERPPRQAAESETAPAPTVWSPTPRASPRFLISLFMCTRVCPRALSVCHVSAWCRGG